jgi:hypothetical protein
VQFTGVHTTYFVQLNHLRPSSQSSDKRDCDTFVAVDELTLPLTEYDTDKLVSIARQFVADATVICNDAVAIGFSALFNWVMRSSSVINCI